MIWTFQDSVEHLLDYQASDSNDKELRFSKRAIREAFTEIQAMHRWKYFMGDGRITTVLPYTTGTVTYDHTGGSQERLLTLSGGTWPDWSEYASVLINTIPYDVAKRISDTQITLMEASNPGSDITDPATFTIYRDTYPLPCDLLHIGNVTSVNHLWQLEYVSPDEWMRNQRVFRSPGAVIYFTVTGDPNYQNQKAIRFHRPPQDEQIFDFIYQRKPRDLVFNDVSAGTISISANSNVIAGTDTAFRIDHVGAILRIGDADNIPTGAEGAFPAVAEYVITSYTGPQAIRINAAPTVAYTDVKYRISDPVDIDQDALLNLFKRACERQLCMICSTKSLPIAEQNFQSAFRAAVALDKTYIGDFGVRSALPWYAGGRLRDFSDVRY